MAPAGPVEQSSSAKPPLTLLTLPPEIHLAILDVLDLQSSVLLGVTCKKFYANHWKRHGEVRMSLRHKNEFSLGSLLYHWMGPNYRTPGCCKVEEILDDQGDEELFERFFTAQDLKEYCGFW